MSILVNKSTRVLVQGMGKAGAFHATQCREYGTHIVGGVSPGKGGTIKDGFALFNTVAEAVRQLRDVHPADRRARRREFRSFAFRTARRLERRVA